MRAIAPGLSTKTPSAYTAPVISASVCLGTRNASAFRSDVLPDPEGPMSASKLPPLASPLRPLKMRLMSSSSAPPSTRDASFFVFTVYVMSRHCKMTPLAEAMPLASAGDKFEAIFEAKVAR